MQYRLIDRAQLKAESKQLLRTAAVPPIFMALLYLGIEQVLNLAAGFFDVSIEYSPGNILGFSVSRLPGITSLFVTILISLVVWLLSAGFTCYCLGVRRGEKMPYSTLFEGFSFAGKVIALTLVMGVFVALWSLLFVIPGIVAIYRYSFAMFYLCENPERGVMECLNLSKQSTRGYKWQYFILGLSFFGWYLLAGVVCDLAALVPVIGAALNILLQLACNMLLLPYLQLTQVGFFLQATAPIAPNEPPRNSWTPEF